MKTEEHLEESHLTRLRLGELTPAEVIAVTTHLASCEACRSLGSGDDGARARRIVDNLVRDSADSHPEETTIDAFVDGTLRFDERERVEAHLDLCDRCATDVEDLREVAASMAATRRGRWRRRLLLAVAAIVVAITTLVLLRPAAREPEPVRELPVIRQTPVKPPATPREPELKAEWAALIAETIRTGRLPVPRELREVQASPESVRGTGEHRAEKISPAEEVLESDRPAFTWPAQKNATGVVFVYRDNDEVTVSEPVKGNRWTPSKPLPREVTLVWQVELRGPGDTARIVPSPPDPPAMFRIVDEASQREIEEARRTHPDNDLLLGILYARAGLKERAIEALERRAAGHPDARPLLRSVQNWP